MIADLDVVTREGLGQADYKRLKQLMNERHLLDTRYGPYVIVMTILLAFTGLALWLTLMTTSTWIQLGGGLLLGLISIQLGLLGHDIGHLQVVREKRLNSVAGYLFGNLLLGISCNWWVDKHNRHHGHPNELGKDPDIDIPVLAFTPQQIASRPKWLRPIIRMQASAILIYFPLQALNARYQSVNYLLRKRPACWQSQVIGVGLFLAWYCLLLVQLEWWVALLYAAVHQAMFGLVNSLLFAPNHKGMEILDQDSKLTFAEKQVRTSRNFTCPPWIDIFCGGLNYQIEHHLFPTMPRWNLKKASVLVRTWCEEEGLPYTSTSLLRAYKDAHDHLRTVVEVESAA